MYRFFIFLTYTIIRVHKIVMYEQNGYKKSFYYIKGML